MTTAQTTDRFHLTQRRQDSQETSTGLQLFLNHRTKPALGLNNRFTDRAAVNTQAVAP